MTSDVIEEVDIPKLEDIEKLISEFFADHLDVEAIDTSDDFFSLGGNSLVMIEIIESLLTKLGNSLKPESIMQAFFEAPTVRGLAKYIHGELANACR